jgi:hypothetical protein
MRAYMVAGRATKLAVPQEKALPACRLGRTLSLMVPLKEALEGAPEPGTRAARDMIQAQDVPTVRPPPCLHAATSCDLFCGTAKKALERLPFSVKM